MKLKYIFPSLFIVLLCFVTGCNDDNSITLLDEIQVSSSYVAIPETGGATTITITAKDSWTVEKTTTEKDGVEWLTLSVTSGAAGETTLTFTAGAALDGRTAEVKIISGNAVQRINIIQGLSGISEATVAEAKAAPDGKNFRVTGVCTEIQNTDYGNWMLTDETGSILVYGTLDAKGQTRNFLSLNIEVGDEVVIEGPRGSYNGSPQFVNVMVIKVNKSLVAIEEVENEVLPVEGGIFTAHLSVKGKGLSVDIPENAKDWLSIASIESAGEKVTVKFQAAPNAGGDRGTTIIFRTTDGSKEYSTETAITQKGAVVKATVAEFLAAEVGDTQYRLTGVITRIANATYGNVYLRDFSGEAYVYGIADYGTHNLKEGDIITIVGKRAAYRDDPQVGGAVLEDVIRVTPITIAEVLTKPDSNTDYYMVTGDIKEIASVPYGNMYLKDGDSEIYLYGCYPGYGATGNFRQGVVEDKGLKVGDKLTVIATKTTYSGTVQLSGGLYFSHVSAE
jgi:hypothetical protein